MNKHYDFDFGPANDAREQLRRWDAGETIWTVEMGGLGPGYEQAIQILAVEIVRDNIDSPLPDTESARRIWGDSTVARIDKPGPDGKYSCGGFSGAQVGAAKNLAFQWIKKGPAECLKSLPDDRKIQASKFFPQAPALGVETPDGALPVQESGTKPERSIKRARSKKKDL